MLHWSSIMGDSKVISDSGLWFTIEWQLLKVLVQLLDKSGVNSFGKGALFIQQCQNSYWLSQEELLQSIKMFTIMQSLYLQGYHIIRQIRIFLLSSNEMWKMSIPSLMYSCCSSIKMCYKQKQQPAHNQLIYREMGEKLVGPFRWIEI